MIHTVTLGFCPKGNKQHMIYKNILDKNKDIKTMINSKDEIIILPQWKWFCVKI